MRQKILLAAAAAVLLPSLAAGTATASPTAGNRLKATGARALLDNVSICDTGSAGLCLSDPGATTQGGTLIDMRSKQTVPSQTILSQADGVYGCTNVEPGCPFTLRPQLNTTLQGAPIVYLNFREIGSNLCVGAASGGQSVILSACSVNRAAWVFVQKPGSNAFELVNIYWSNIIDLPGGQALTGSDSIGSNAGINQYVAGSLQLWRP